MDAKAEALYERLKTRARGRLMQLLETDTSNSHGTAHRKPDRQALQGELRRVVQQLLEDAPNALAAPEQERLIAEVLSDIVGLGPLDEFFTDETISEIMVNGPQEIFIERDGRIERTAASFRDAQHLRIVIERMLDAVGLAVNETEPICDASLPDGSRINVIIPPLVLNGPTVTIRRKSRDWTVSEYVRQGAVSEQAAEFLEACVRAKVNLVVSGGTSTGKTTIVSLLSSFIPAHERIITIENVAELELLGREHWVRLVGRVANMQGRGEIPLRALVKNALRMRPDRIILGEARGGEALDVVQAMHTGHDGVITVLHGNTAVAALERLETLMLMSGLDLPPEACRTQILSGVDLVIHMARFPDGSRRVEAITQPLGTNADGYQMQELFKLDVKGFNPEGQLDAALTYTGATPKFMKKFSVNNITLPAWMTA